MPSLRSTALTCLALHVWLPRTAVAEPEVRLTPREAVQLALEKNLGLRYDRMDPSLTRASEEIARAAFHPTLYSGLDASGPSGSNARQRAGIEPSASVSAGGDLGVRQTFVTGTTLEGNLVSVTERIREIGIRKALGARRRDILFQFLVESVVLSGIGGLLGVGLGVGGSQLLALVAGWETAVSGGSVVLAFGVATIIGVFFGLYPAHKASRLDPIEALRHE